MKNGVENSLITSIFENDLLRQVKYRGVPIGIKN